MKKYKKFISELNEIEIAEGYDVVISDKDNYSELLNRIKFGLTLPENVSFKIVEKKQITFDEELDQDNLPGNIVVDSHEIIKDTNRINEINEYVRKNKGEYPSGVTRKIIQIDGVEQSSDYYDLNKPIYVENIYEFTEKIYLSDEEIETLVRIKTAKSIKDLVTTQQSFMVFSIFTGITSMLLLIVLLIIIL